MFICLLIVTVNCYYFYFVVLGFFSFVWGGGVSCENGMFGQFVMGKQSEDTV